MKIIEITERNSAWIEKLLDIWETSVKATHLFLSGGEIEAIKQYVPQALKEIPHLVVAEDETGEPVGFMGVVDQMLEMLFVSAKERGKGIGKQLLEHGMDKYSVKSWLSMNRILLRRGSMSIWALQFIKGQTSMSREMPIPLLYMKRN